MKVTTTPTAKDFVQTESIPDPIERQKANVATKGKQPIVATEFEDIESNGSKDSDESDEEFAAEEELEYEEEVPTKTTSKTNASTKEKGKGIQSSDTQWYVAANALLPLFFTKKSESLMHALDTKEFISKRNIDLESFRILSVRKIIIDI